jgi:hypothetical protein
MLAALICMTAGVTQADTTSADRHHAGKKGTVKIWSATVAGDVTLQPGDYEVRQVRSREGDSVEFTRVWRNDFSPEGVSPYEREVVARVKCTLQPVAETPKLTRLMSASNGSQAIGLEIRGSRFEYLF